MWKIAKGHFPLLSLLPVQASAAVKPQHGWQEAQCSDWLSSSIHLAEGWLSQRTHYPAALTSLHSSGAVALLGSSSLHKAWCSMQRACEGQARGVWPWSAGLHDAQLLWKLSCRGRSGALIAPQVWEGFAVLCDSWWVRVPFEGFQANVSKG